MTEIELGDLMPRTYRPLFHMIISQVGDEEAEVILQDVYWRAWKHLALDDRDPMPWLKKVAWNRVNTQLRRRYGIQPVSLERLMEEGFDAAAPASAPDAVAWLQEVLPSLPPMRRAILWLREIAGWDDARIAARLGIAEPTVRRHASLATGQLRARLGVW